MRLDKLANYRELPQRRDSTFLGGQFLLPGYIYVDGMPPLRPMVSMWLDAESGVIIAIDPLRRPEDCTEETLLECLISPPEPFPTVPFRPGHIVVHTQQQADYIKGVLDLPDTSITVEDVSEAFLEPLMDMAEHIGGRAVETGVAYGRDVTEEDYIAYAAAADEFYRAAPWRELQSDDPIVVASPAAPRGFKCLSVMGSAGIERGIGFFPSLQAYWRFRRVTDPSEFEIEFPNGLWSLNYGQIHEMPVADGDLWNRLNLPVANDNAYPWLHEMADLGEPSPSAKVVRFVTGLLRTLARATPAQIDAGRITATVEVSHQPIEYILELPEVLKPSTTRQLINRAVLIDPRFYARVEMPAGAPEPVRKAAELAKAAYGTIGRRRIILARQALALDPDSVDARLVLAEHSTEAEEALNLFTGALRSAERLVQNADRDFPAPDPYAHAILGRSHALSQLDKLAESEEQLRTAIAAFPNDERFGNLLLETLLEDGKDAEAAALTASPTGVTPTVSAMASAILAYRLGGDCPAARQELIGAISRNPLIAVMLITQDVHHTPWPYEPGAPSEAALVASTLRRPIETTRGFTEFMSKTLEHELPAMLMSQFPGHAKRSAPKGKKKKHP